MKETEVSNAIKNGFLYFRLLARADLERNWKNMSLQQRWAAGRALVYIGRLAKNPRMYLSRKIVVDNFLEHAFISQFISTSFACIKNK